MQRGHDGYQMPTNHLPSLTRCKAAVGARVHARCAVILDGRLGEDYVLQAMQAGSMIERVQGVLAASFGWAGMTPGLVGVILDACWHHAQSMTHA